MQGGADAHLPMAGLHGFDLLGNLPQRGEYQRPGEFGGGVRGNARMLARRYDNAEAGAGGDIDMWVDAALADQLQFRQPLEQPRLYFRALANEHEYFNILEALGEHIV